MGAVCRGLLAGCWASSRVGVLELNEYPTVSAPALCQRDVERGTAQRCAAHLQPGQQGLPRTQHSRPPPPQVRPCECRTGRRLSTLPSTPGAHEDPSPCRTRLCPSLLCRGERERSQRPEPELSDWKPDPRASRRAAASCRGRFSPPGQRRGAAGGRAPAPGGGSPHAWRGDGGVSTAAVTREN